MEGEILAARYAYNCPKAASIFILLQSFLNSDSREDLGRLRSALEELDAYPFYKAIATAHGIANPFDCRVVKAHWLGNELLEIFSTNSLPHHNLTCLADAEKAEKFLEEWGLFCFNKIVNFCRVDYATIQKVEPEDILVEGRSISRKEEKFFLKNSVYQVSRGIISDIKTGDLVSIHWGVAREKISIWEKEWLEKTNLQLIEILNHKGL